MSNRCNQQPRKISTTEEGPQTYHVAWMGMCQEVRRVPHAPEAPTASSSIHLPEQHMLNMPDEIQQLIDAAETRFANKHFPANNPNFVPAMDKDVLADELDLMLEDTDELLNEPKASGAKQNDSGVDEQILQHVPMRVIYGICFPSGHPLSL
ncbi:unnamed protein product [Rhizoctonia solani]|uniref:Uncharacterized protein n=1 Tax=Rhizoctonia solani TaxID=456999 RepID=A0A8H3AJL1_9AGAM|nr:unnamed protein product [Rhizoctonia solani]